MTTGPTAQTAFERRIKKAGLYKRQCRQYTGKKVKLARNRVADVLEPLKPQDLLDPPYWLHSKYLPLGCTKVGLTSGSSTLKSHGVSGKQFDPSRVSSPSKALKIEARAEDADPLHEVLAELRQLMEAYAPSWYTEELRQRISKVLNS